MFRSTRFSWIGLSALLVVVVILAGCNAAAPSQAPSIGDRLVATFGVFDNLPTSEQDALAQGWIDTGECVPQMGRHFIKMAGQQPGPLVLLFNPQGKLISVELESLTEQPAPPWEHLEQGHPGMEKEAVSSAAAAVALPQDGGR